MNYIVVFITASSKKEAEKIAQGLVKNRLAACVNIIGAVDSVFSWKNKIECAKEAMLIVKSQKKNLNRIIENVRRLHSYQVPEIIAVPIVGGFNKYLNWIKDETD